MSKYPTEITEKILLANKDIDDLIIIQDISDTEQEIELREETLEDRLANTQLLIGTPQGKMADFRISASQQILSEMKEFMAFLKLLRAARKI